MPINYKDFEPLIIVLIFGVLGFIVAMIVKTLHDSGVVVGEILVTPGGTITITNAMTFIVIIFLIIGIVVAATRQ